MPHKTAKDKLKLILDGLTGSTASDLFLQSFDYFETTPQNYPCAMVGILAGSSERMIDTAYNETEMQFLIRVLMKNKNDSSTHDSLLTILDSLLDTLRDEANLTLGGSAQMMQPIEWDVFYTDRTDEPTVGFEIVINVLKLNQTF